MMGVEKLGSAQEALMGTRQSYATMRWFAAAWQRPVAGYAEPTAADQKFSKSRLKKPLWRTRSVDFGPKKAIIWTRKSLFFVLKKPFFRTSLGGSFPGPVFRHSSASAP